MEELELTKEQIKEFAIYIDLADIRTFIQDNQKEYELWLKQEQGNNFIFGTCEICLKIEKLKNVKSFDVLEMVL